MGKMSEQDRQQLCADYEAKSATTGELQARYGISKTALYKALADAGVTPHTRRSHHRATLDDSCLDGAGQLAVMLRAQFPTLEQVDDAVLWAASARFLDSLPAAQRDLLTG